MVVYTLKYGRIICSSVYYITLFPPFHHSSHGFVPPSIVIFTDFGPSGVILQVDLPGEPLCTIKVNKSVGFGTINRHSSLVGLAYLVENRRSALPRVINEVCYLMMDCHFRRRKTGMVLSISQVAKHTATRVVGML